MTDKPTDILAVIADAIVGAVSDISDHARLSLQGADPHDVHVVTGAQLRGIVLAELSAAEKTGQLCVFPF